MSPSTSSRPRAYAVGDLARIAGSTPPFEEGERINGYLTIRPGTVYLGNVEWWRYTANPRELYCTICDCSVTNYYMAIDHHVQQRHASHQV